MDQKNRTYRTALYCRISREDGDKSESDSIVVQRHMLEDYCARNPELTVVSCYTDDGYTGTNFNRPDFQRMLADIEDGKIDCVIVKDLSRFGRDYIDIGYYLERYFPAKGVRFIAINDQVDSLQGPYDMMLPLKNVFNAQYAKDTSEKVRKSFRTKMQRGEFVSAFPPYGYAKDENNKNHFVIDPEAAKNVLTIFESRAAGMSQRKIADMLNESGALSPIEYKHSKGIRLSINKRYKGTCYWSDSAVARILQNEMYLGNMVSNRYPSDTMHGKSREAPRSEWIVVEGMHEPIISVDLWDAVHAIAGKEKKERPKQEKTGLFSGFLRCGDCGRALVRKGGDNRNYYCSAYKEYGAIACSKHAIREDELAEVVLSDLNQLISQVKNLGELSEKQYAKRSAAQAVDIRRTDAVRAKIQRQKQRLYEDYRAGSVSREDYIRRKADYDSQEHALAEDVREPTESGPQNTTAKHSWVEKLLRMKKLESLDRMILQETVREIRVFDDGRIEICYLFSDEFSRLFGDNKKT